MPQGKVKEYNWRTGKGKLILPGREEEFPFSKGDVALLYRRSIRKNDDVRFEWDHSYGSIQGSKPINIDYVPRSWEHLQRISSGIDFNRDYFIGRIKGSGALIHKPGAELFCEDPKFEGHHIWVFYRRFLAPLSDKNIDGPIVFLPVKGTDPKNKYEAAFALPMQEARPEDLLKIYKRDQGTLYPGLKAYIQENYIEEDWRHRLEKAMEDGDLLQIKALVQEFKEKHQRVPTFMDSDVSESEHLFLWLNNLSDEPPFESVFNLFGSDEASYQDRAEILAQCSEELRNRLLTSFGDELKGRIQAGLRRGIKSYLDLLEKHGSDTLEALRYRENFLAFLKEWLSGKELVDYWLKGYLKELASPDYAFNHLNIKDSRQLKLLSQIGEKTAFNREVFNKVLDALFSPSLNFKTDYPSIVHIGKSMKQGMGGENYEVKIVSRLKKLRPEEQFILSVLGVDVGQEPNKLFQQISNYEGAEVTVFLMIASGIPEVGIPNTVFNHIFQAPDPEAYLKNLLLIFSWNRLVDPAEFLSKIVRGWLTKMDSYFPRPLPKAEDLAVWLYDHLRPFSFHHLRLWLAFNPQLIDRFDYFEFAEVFPELSKKDRKRIRAAADGIMFDLVEDYEQRTLLPCTNKSINEDITIYSADFSNLFFSQNAVQLLIDDDTFTKQYKLPGITPAWNRISLPNPIYKKEISIKVDNWNQSILSIEGLKEVINKSFFDRIKSIVKYNKSQLSDEKKYNCGETYSIDQSLKKRVTEYLDSRHERAIPVRPIKEAIPVYGGGYSLRKGRTAQLYSIAEDDKIIIVWESLDFTESNSTYVFKFSLGMAEEGLERVSEAIRRISRLRSILSRNFSEEQPEFIEGQHKLSSYLGYLGNIRKRRGLRDAFERWERKFFEICGLKPLPITHECDISEIKELFSQRHVKIPGIRIPVDRTSDPIQEIEGSLPDFEVSAETVDELEEIKSHLDRLYQGFLSGL